jgi:hypothetical protein
MIGRREPRLPGSNNHNVDLADDFHMAIIGWLLIDGLYI